MSRPAVNCRGIAGFARDTRFRHGRSQQTPVANPKPILDHMRQHMVSASSFYLELVQKRRLKLFDEPLKSEGIMLMERTVEMRWVLGQPAGETILRAANRARQSLDHK